MNLHCFQHAPFEGLGHIAKWAEARGHSVAHTRFYEPARLPDAASVDFLVVMGGPMNVYEYRNHPWLPAEKEFISRMIDRGTLVLGVCLGAQLIADVLGAKVYQNAEREIGWLPIRWRSLPTTRRLLGREGSGMTVFHWHGDTFDLPTRAEWLAESDGCKHQAFAFRRHVVALQFHLEVEAADVAAMVKHGEAELSGGRYVQGAREILQVPAAIESCHTLCWHLLDRMVGNS